ncbi:MAG: alpha/beta fold hydrolase [Anaerolineales bacterium]
MPYVSTDYGRLFVTDRSGDAPPLLLIHGAGSDHLSWSAPLRRLPGRRVLAPDLPGHGRSAGDAQADVMPYANAVIALLDALAVPKAIIAGHSMGGAIAQTLALDHSERVAGLILVTTGARLPVNPQILQTVHADSAQVVEWITKWAWAPDAPADMRALGRQALMQVSPQVLYADYLACDRFDIRARLGEITAPTLVIGGELDKMTPPKFSHTLATGIPGAELRIIPGGGHYVVLEQPDTVTNIVKTWLEERDS